MATFEAVVNAESNAYVNIRNGLEAEMGVSEADWQSLVKGMLKAEIKRRHLTYEALAAKLAELDVHETAANIRVKISRGGFSAVFLIQCLRAMGVETLRLS